MLRMIPGVEGLPPVEMKHFFDVRGMVRYEFLPQGQTVNQHVYKKILQRLLRSGREKGEVGKQHMVASSQ